MKCKLKIIQDLKQSPVIVMTSLPAANCSRSLLLQSEWFRWFDGVSVVQPVPMSMMTVSVVDLEVQRLAADRQSCKPARIQYPASHFCLDSGATALFAPFRNEEVLFATQTAYNH